MARTRLNIVRESISSRAIASGRDPGEIELVVVTKYATDEAVEAVIGDGARILGESRAAGLESRAEAFPGVEWHFIGHLQRNKARRVGRSAAVLHSMDRESLARRWGGLDSAPPVYVQVDLAGEPQKGGVAPEGAVGLVEACATSGIEVLGLMTIPPLGRGPEDARPWFAALRDLRDRLVRDHPSADGLSMGMSGDYEVAIEEGATVLRVGRAIFDTSGDDED